MLKDEDRIFKNLYNDLRRRFIFSSKKRQIGLILKKYVPKEEIG